NKKVNIKSIANDLGVSPSTVSKALKDSHEISEGTRERIKAYAKLHNYRPNRLAMSLRSQKTNVIGIIIPEIVHHFFSRVLYGIESFAYKHDYSLMICLSKDELDKEIKNIEMLTNGNVDGLLVSVAKETLESSELAHFNQLIERDFPLVFLDRVPANLEIDKVIIDDVAGGYKAAEHLIEKGCKRLAILTTPSHINVGNQREKGFFKALKEFDLPIIDSYNIKVNEKYAEKEKYYIEDQIEVLFSQEKLPDGIFAVNEIYAAIALKIAHKKGLKVPEDIAIIGFTDGIISKTTNPALSTVAQHGYTMGAQAMELLLDRISNKNTDSPYRTSVISTNVVEREST
ncbi:MAG: LacI family DNA-binding transcriptional regulator, partial [Flavobacteriaceae bacterium]